MWGILALISVLESKISYPGVFAGEFALGLAGRDRDDFSDVMTWDLGSVGRPLLLPGKAPPFARWSRKDAVLVGYEGRSFIARSSDSSGLGAMDFSEPFWLIM